MYLSVCVCVFIRMFGCSVCEYMYKCVHTTRIGCFIYIEKISDIRIPYNKDNQEMHIT